MLYQKSKRAVILVLTSWLTASILASAAGSSERLITFDNLSLQTYGEPILDGYAGLAWVDFGVLEPRRYPGQVAGYLNGMVSPSNVAFNAFANPDGSVTGSFGSFDCTFDLQSVYATAAWNDGLQLDVLGFVKGDLKYSTVYTLNTAAPALISLNYSAIDEVRFVSYGGTPRGDPGSGGAQAVIDNLLIIVPENSPLNLLLFALLANFCIGRLKRPLTSNTRLP